MVWSVLWMATEKKSARERGRRVRLDKKSGQSLFANSFKCLNEAGVALLRVLVSHYQ